MELILLILISLNLLATGWLLRQRTDKPQPAGANVITFDTSAIIDGRILEVAKVGFLPTQIRVPQFILDELHNIADSADNMRRERGRFGLEVVNDLGKLPGMSVEVVETSKSDKPVDDRLVEFAEEIGGKVVSNDYALIQIARIRGVDVLNVNELSQAIRTIALPGERFELKLVQKGSDKGQGVGYLEDGTMVVVDKADRLLGKTVEVEVTRIFQTSAGKMLFADLVKKPSSGKSKRRR